MLQIQPISDNCQLIGVAANRPIELEWPSILGDRWMGCRTALKICGLLALWTTAMTGSCAAAQEKKALDKFALAATHQMLRTTYEELKKNYYDSALHGVDLDTIYKKVDKELDAASTNSDALFLIAGFVSTLHDSHTFLIPPSRVSRMDRGFQMVTYGDDCFITRVRPGSDAAKKLHIGDKVLSINGYKTNRRSYEALQYLFHIILPVPSLTMIVQNPEGVERTEMVNASFTPGKKELDLTGDETTADFQHLILDQENEEHRTRERVFEVGNIAIWMMPDFEASDEAINAAWAKVGKHENLILDLRGNEGGSSSTLNLMLQHVFDHNIKVDDRVSRKDTKPEIMHAGKPGTYRGKVFVLLNSNSASAAEIFGRVMQLEKRGIVIGDYSAGAVMEARWFPESVGIDSKIFYAISISSANLLMSDGKSLENVGVVPDVIALPTGASMTAGEDPVMAQAVKLAGGQMDATAAGKLFPYEWAKQ